METGLLPFLDWCVEACAPEAAAAARWADQFMALPDRRERGRRMLAEISERVVASGSPRDFVEDLPGVRGVLPVEAAYLIYRMVKTHLYVAAARGLPLVDVQGLKDQNLLLAGAELGLPPFASALSERGPAAAILQRRFPRGRSEAAEIVQIELLRRVAALEGRPFSDALRSALEFLTLASAADFADAYYEGMVVHPQQLANLAGAAARRTVAVTGLVKLVAWADGILSVEEEAMLAAVRQVVPSQPQEVLREAIASMSPEQLPQVLPFAEERQGVLQCMLAMALTDGRLDSAQEELCRDVAALLELPEADVDRVRAQLQAEPG